MQTNQVVEEEEDVESNGTGIDFDPDQHVRYVCYCGWRGHSGEITSLHVRWCPQCGSFNLNIDHTWGRRAADARG